MADMKCLRCRRPAQTPFCGYCINDYDVRGRMYVRQTPSWLRTKFSIHKNDFQSIDDAEAHVATVGTVAELGRVIRFAIANGYEYWDKSVNQQATRLLRLNMYCDGPGHDVLVSLGQDIQLNFDGCTKIQPYEYKVDYDKFGPVMDYLLGTFAIVNADDGVRNWASRGAPSEHPQIVRWAINNTKTEPITIRRGQIQGGDFVALRDGVFVRFNDLFNLAAQYGSRREDYGYSWSAPANHNNLRILLERVSLYPSEGIEACTELARLLSRDKWIHAGLIWRMHTELYKPDQLHRFVYEGVGEQKKDPFDPLGLFVKQAPKIPIKDLEEWERYLNGMRPFSQQKIAAEIAYNVRHIGFWMDMRVGKTPTSMMVARRMLVEGHVDQVFFVAPAVNTYDPWVNELNKQGWFNVCSLDEGAKIDETNLASGIPNAFVISYDSLLTRQHIISKHIDLMRTGWVIDETALVKNPGSKRAKVVADMTEHSVFTLCLNGTPLAQGPQDIWSQQYIYDRGVTFGTRYPAFEREWLAKAGTKTIIARGKDMTFELQISSSSIRYLRSEADQFSGKDKNYRYVVIPPTERMREATQEILAGFTTAGGEESEIKNNILVIYGHLREACAAYDKYEVIKDSGIYKRVRHEEDPKVLWLKVFLKANPGQPVICFFEFSESEDKVMEMLESEGYNYSSLRRKYSKTPRGSEERAEEIRKFQEGETQVFIMKSSQAKGITLNRIPAVKAGIGNYPVIVYFQPSWSIIDWEQSNDRAVGTDPKTNKSISTMIYALVIRGSIEAEIIKALRRKKNVAETLLADAGRNGYVNAFSEMDMSTEAQGKTSGDDVFDSYEYECRYALEISPGKALTRKLIEKQLNKFPACTEQAEYLIEKIEEAK